MFKLITERFFLRHSLQTSVIKIILKITHQKFKFPLNICMCMYINLNINTNDLSNVPSLSKPYNTLYVLIDLNV